MLIAIANRAHARHGGRARKGNNGALGDGLAIRRAGLKIPRKETDETGAPKTTFTLAPVPRRGSDGRRRRLSARPDP